YFHTRDAPESPSSGGPSPRQALARARAGSAVPFHRVRARVAPLAVGKEDCMSTNPIRSTAAAAEAPPPVGTTDPAPTPTPTITHYQQLADNFSKALDEIAQIIPKLEIAHPAPANFVRPHLHRPTEFLATAIAAVEQTPELQGVNKLDVTEARDTLQFIE